MAEFLERSLDCLKQLSLPSPFAEITDDPILLAELCGAGCSVMDSLSPTMGLMDYYVPFSIDDDGGGGEFSCFPPISAAAEPPPPLPPPPVGGVAEQNHVDRKRRMVATPETSTNKKNNGWKRRRRLKSADSNQGEKPREVVHVRARRGQATDSHSLAERVRRRKINERMRCLQDLVPGCYKTMGMAGVLDEIINYVQSLQNQVEFLSMKLSAANSFYDFNLGVESVPTNQVADNNNKANEIEMRGLLRPRGGGCDHVASATSTHHRQNHHQQNRCTFDS